MYNKNSQKFESLLRGEKYWIHHLIPSDDDDDETILIVQIDDCIYTSWPTCLFDPDDVSLSTGYFGAH